MKCISERLPSDCFGILCTRQHTDRIREALLPSSADNGWQSLSNGAKVDALSSQPHSIDSSNGKYIVIPTPEEKGPRKDRTGYSLLVIFGAAMSPVDLPPMARKQLSWAGRLTHQLALTNVDGCIEENGAGVANEECNQLQPILEPVVHEIWCELSSKSFDTENDFLRLDVQPKSHNSQVFEAFSKMEHIPIKFAFAASKVSHVVNIVIQNNTTIYWGISNYKQHFENLNQRLNDHATSEVVMEPTSPQTGLDLHSDTDQYAPVSRAYYKLAQIFEDESLLQMIASLHNNSNKETVDITKKSLLSHGAGLDIGASPGGWTQVLRNTVGIPNVVAIDRGVIAQRVMTLGGVHHICAELSSEESIKGIAHLAPYSTIVCDASVSNANELLEKIADTLNGVSSLLQATTDDSSNGNSLQTKNIFAWPLCLVVTLKLPHKTIGSIDRNMEKVNNYIPDYLRRLDKLQDLSLDSRINYKIYHLHTNSAAERTLVAIINKKL